MSEGEDGRPMAGWSRVFRMEDVEKPAQGEESELDLDDVTVQHRALPKKKQHRPASIEERVSHSVSDDGESTVLDTPFSRVHLPQIVKPAPFDEDEDDEPVNPTVLDQQTSTLLDFSDGTEPTPVAEERGSSERTEPRVMVSFREEIEEAPPPPPPRPSRPERLPPPKNSAPPRAIIEKRSDVPPVKKTNDGLPRVSGLAPSSSSFGAAPVSGSFGGPPARKTLPHPKDRGAGDALLQNAAIAIEAPKQGAESAPELTQIHAAAALGIAPEPAPPPIAPQENPEPIPPPLEKIDFGELKLEEREVVLARYPIEAPGAGLAEKIEQGAPLIVSVSKLLPLVITASLFFGVVIALVLTFNSRSNRLKPTPLAEVAAPSGAVLPESKGEPPIDPSPEPATIEQAMQQAPIAAPPPPREQQAVIAPPVGSLRFSSEPDQAAIEVDGLMIGKTPLIMVAPEGDRRYDVRLLMQGYRAWQGKIFRDGSGGYAVEMPDGSPYSSPSFEQDARGDYVMSVSLEKE